MLLLRFSRGQSSESLEPLLGLLPSSGWNSAAIWTFLRVADHLPHLYEDAVHAGGLARPAGRRLLLEQRVGDGDTVAEGGVVIIVIPTSPPSAKVLHSTSHGCQHQESYEACVLIIIISTTLHLKHQVNTLIIEIVSASKRCIIIEVGKGQIPINLYLDTLPHCWYCIAINFYYKQLMKFLLYQQCNLKINTSFIKDERNCYYQTFYITFLLKTKKLRVSKANLYQRIENLKVIHK